MLLATSGQSAHLWALGRSSANPESSLAFETGGLNLRVACHTLKVKYESHFSSVKRLTIPGCADIRGGSKTVE